MLVVVLQGVRWSLSNAREQVEQDRIGQRQHLYVRPEQGYQHQHQVHPEVVHVLHNFLVNNFKLAVVLKALWNAELLSFGVPRELEVHLQILFQEL